MARKKHHEEHENLERWLVSYADFITLLFAFFTVLYALGQSDKAKYQKAVENIQRAFLSSGGIFPMKGVPFSTFDKADKGSPSPPSPAQEGPWGKSDPQSLDDVKSEIEGLYQKTVGMGLQNGDAEILKTDGGYKIRLGEYLLFRPGSDKIRRESLPFIFEIGKRLAKTATNVSVEGHTDTSSPSGNRSNWLLSVTRSFNVVQFLVEGVKFPKERISIHGFGDTRPIADNDSPEGRARNRRVEISISTVEPEGSE